MFKVFLVISQANIDGFCSNLDFFKELRNLHPLQPSVLATRGRHRAKLPEK